MNLYRATLNNDKNLIGSVADGKATDIGLTVTKYCGVGFDPARESRLDIASHHNYGVIIETSSWRRVADRPQLLILRETSSDHKSLGTIHGHGCELAVRFNYGALARQDLRLVGVGEAGRLSCH